MCGAYIGIDEYRSKLAVLAEKLSPDPIVKETSPYASVNGRSIWNPALWRSMQRAIFRLQFCFYAMYFSTSVSRINGYSSWVQTSHLSECTSLKDSRKRKAITPLYRVPDWMVVHVLLHALLLRDIGTQCMYWHPQTFLSHALSGFNPKVWQRLWENSLRTIPYIRQAHDTADIMSDNVHLLNTHSYTCLMRSGNLNAVRLYTASNCHCPKADIYLGI